MEQDRREQLLNQFFINNIRPGALDMRRSSRKYLNARDVLATRLSQDQDMFASTTHVGFVKSATRGSYDDYYFDKYLYKDDSIINKENDPLEFYEWHGGEKRFRYCPVKSYYSLYKRGEKEGPFYYRNKNYSEDRTEKDEAAEREMIETNLTYDGYCLFLSLLPSSALLYFKDSITLGINNLAKENISKATSKQELNTLHQDYLQLKAAAEYLFEQAETEQEELQKDMLDELLQEKELEELTYKEMKPDIDKALADFQ